MPEPPRCVGTYESDHPTCNGDPTGLTEQERLPCAWRNRCAGLQLFCHETSQIPEIVVATLDYDRLVQLCETRVEIHDIVDGIPGGPPKPEPEPKSPARPKKRTSRTISSKKNGGSKAPLSDDVLALGSHFERCLKDEFPNRRFAKKKRVLAKPGTFYPVDRTRASRYLSWYCTTDKGQDRAIACLRFKPRLGSVDIGLPVQVEVLRDALDEKTFQRFAPKASVLGQFQSLLKHLDREAVGLAAETIKRLVDRELLEVS